MSTTLRGIYRLAGISFVILSACAGTAQDSAFTYQGRLLEQGQPANGSYDFLFRLKDAATNGNYVGSPVSKAPVPVSNGLFTTLLDFGESVFSGAPIWLEIGVRTNGSLAAYTVLNPPQALTPAPLATFARSAATAGTATNLVAGAPITGNGAGITNLNGTNISPGTISSNALDQGTWSALTNQIGAQGGSGVNNSLTNPTLRITGPSAPVLRVTNYVGFAPDITRNFQSTNSLVLLADSVGATDGIGAAGFHLAVRDVNQGYMDWFYNPYHDVFTDHATYTNYSMEMQMTMSGGWSVSTAYGGGPGSTGYSRTRRAWQWGIGGYGQPYIYHQHGYVPHADNTNLFDSMYPEFFVCNVYTNTGALVAAGSLDPDFYFIPSVMFSAIDTNGNAAWTWYDSFDVNVQDNGQYNFNTAKKRFQIIAGPAGGVSFNGKLANDGFTAISTNVFIGSTVLTIHNGLVVGCGPIDADATSFFSRIGSVSTSVTNALLTFLSSVKSDGTWTNFDAVYPFMGTNSAGNGQNLVSTNYTISWNGTFTVMDTTGVQGDGLTGYGDTHWKITNQNACALFAYMKTDSSDLTAWGLGANDGSVASGFRHNSSANFDSIMNQTYSSLLVTPTLSFPSALMVVRTDSAHFSAYYGSNASSTFFSTSASPPNYNVYIFAWNYQGTAGHFWSGKHQVIALANHAPSLSQYQTLYNACVALNAALGR